MRQRGARWMVPLTCNTHKIYKLVLMVYLRGTLLQCTDHWYENIHLLCLQQPTHQRHSTSLQQCLRVSTRQNETFLLAIKESEVALQSCCSCSWSRTTEPGLHCGPLPGHSAHQSLESWDGQGWTASSPRKTHIEGKCTQYIPKTR